MLPAAQRGENLDPLLEPPVRGRGQRPMIPRHIFSPTTSRSSSQPSRQPTQTSPHQLTDSAPSSSASFTLPQEPPGLADEETALSSGNSFTKNFAMASKANQYKEFKEPLFLVVLFLCLAW